MVGTDRGEILAFRPSRLNVNTSPGEGVTKLTQSDFTYLHSPEGRVKSAFKKLISFGRAGQNAPRGSILAIEMVGPYVFAISADNQLICRAIDNSTSWQLQISN